MGKSLTVLYGSLEQHSLAFANETEEQYCRRLKLAHERAMGDNADSLVQLLQRSQKLGAVNSKVYDGEDHGSVISCALNTCITAILSGVNGRLSERGS